MTALRRLIDDIPAALVAALALSFAVPAAAQNSDTPIDVTAAPPPSSETVGPSQLRDFTLNGTVTRPADRPAATQPAPAQAPRAEAPANSTSRQAGPTGRATTARPAPASSRSPIVDVGSADLPSATLPEASNPIPETAIIADELPSETAPIPAVGNEGSFWPWIAALIALAGGGVYLLRARRGQRARYADFDRLAFVGPQEGQAELPHPAPAPKPAGGVRPPWPEAAKPASNAKPAPKPESDGGIVSSRLRPELNVHFAPDRAVVTEREVMLQFDITITNSGSAPARDVLVEGKMVTAHAAQDSEIASFFAAPAGQGDRMALIPPLGRIALKSAVRLPLDQLHSFEVDGRRLFVPLVALNILFRSGSGDGQASASFLVGRGGDEDEKLAPFRLDLGPRIFRGLSARPHSMGLQR